MAEDEHDELIESEAAEISLPTDVLDPRGAEMHRIAEYLEEAGYVSNSEFVSEVTLQVSVEDGASVVSYTIEKPSLHQ